MLTARRSRVRPSLVASALVVTTACAAAPPARAPQPSLTLPSAWTAATADRAAPVADWWTTFGSVGLTAAVEEALASNQDLRAAAARVAQAEAGARAAGASRVPQLNAAFDATRSRRNFIGFPIPGSGDEGVLSTTTSTLGVSLNASWEPDVWGRLRSGEAAALADRAAAAALYHGARLSLTAQTTKAWLAVAEARLQVELAERTLASRAETATRVTFRYEQGLRPSLDVRLAQVAEAGAAAALAARRRQLDAAVRQLEVLLGRYPAGAFEPSGTLPALEAAVPAGLPADLIARRPDLLAAEMRLVSSGALVAEARTQLLPRITLTAGAGTASSALLDLLDGDFGVWNLVAGLTQPIFQGGRLRANVDGAEARREEAVAAYAQQALRAFAEVETALNADRFLAEQERALARSLEEAAAARQVSEDRYFAGLAGYLDVLESQRQAFTAESQLIEARLVRLATRVDLHLALGGDFDDPYVLTAPSSRKEHRP